MYLHGNQTKDRAWAIAGVVAVHGLLAYALLSGLATRESERASDSLKLIDIAEPVPPPPPEPPPEESSKATGEPSPPNLRAVPSPIVAPPPRIPTPSPIVAAPVPSTGSAPSAGASSVAGPGTGAGGAGTGLGGGGSGTGGGNRAQLIQGRLMDSDYPDRARRAGAEGAVAVRFTVQPNGRVSGCQIVKSSGNADLDSTTCRLIERRFRYRPARDAQGRAIAEVTTKLYTWGLNRRQR
jgi:protein TonB